MLVHVASADLVLGGQSFKLQYAARSRHLRSGVRLGELYRHVTGSSAIRYYNSLTAADSWLLRVNTNDPTHGVDSIMAQTYEEANNLTNSVAVIGAGEDGMWDFALVDNSAPPSTAYCLRLFKDDGTPIDIYSVIPEITTQ